LLSPGSNRICFIPSVALSVCVLCFDVVVLHTSFSSYSNDPTLKLLISTGLDGKIVTVLVAAIGFRQVVLFCFSISCGFVKISGQRWYEKFSYCIHTSTWDIYQRVNLGRSKEGKQRTMLKNELNVFAMGLLGRE